MSETNDSTRRPAKGPRIGLAQIAPALGDTEANLERHRAAVEKAVAAGCDVLVFPELGLAGYRLKDSVPDVAVQQGGETWKQLEELSTGITLFVGLVEESADHLFFNSVACFEGGRTLAVHRKTYLPTYGMFDEQRYFARGRSIAAFDTKHGRVAMLICEDMLHPSAATIAACDGATLLIVPSASPARGVTGEGEADGNARSWEAYLQVMARSFGVWIAYCNRVGVEDGVSFWGGSEILSPAGDRVAKAAYYDEDFVSGVVSDDAVRRRRIANPLVRDEDLDLTINELSRIRGRAVESAAQAASGDSDKRKAAKGSDFADGEKPPRRFDRKEPRQDREDRPRRDDGGFAPPRRARDDDDRPRFQKPRFDEPRDRFAPRFGGGARDEGDRPRFQRQDSDGPPRDRFAPRFGGGARDEGDRPRFQKPGFSKPGFGGARRDDRDEGDRPRFQKPGFQKPGFAGPPRGRFGGGARDRDDAPRGRFGGGDRPGDDKPRGRGSFGGAAGFGPPRGGEGGGFAGKGRFAASAPRERQRPDPARKPFHKGAKPRGRGRRDD
ncbi:MAG TPA: nitrilase-related carbon-nitrogen hydrolase [Candidatus Limnocylindrales bacterium]|nr:nitrilase-related carbon-nitrogen hydrolase [Candidatus Limnocylindrales bacterium]